MSNNDAFDKEMHAMPDNMDSSSTKKAFAEFSKLTADRSNNAIRNLFAGIVSELQILELRDREGKYFLVNFYRNGKDGQENIGQLGCPPEAEMDLLCMFLTLGANPNSEIKVSYNGEYLTKENILKFLVMLEGAPLGEKMPIASYMVDAPTTVN